MIHKTENILYKKYANFVLRLLLDFSVSFKFQYQLASTKRFLYKMVIN